MRNYCAMILIAFSAALSANSTHTSDIARGVERPRAPYHEAGGEYGRAGNGYHPEARAYARGAEEGAGQNNGGGGNNIYVQPQETNAPPPAAPPPQ